MLLNFDTFNAIASDNEEDSANEEEGRKTTEKETRDTASRGRSPARQLIFYADDFYICHQAIKLQAEALERSDIDLEMFTNGQELISRLKAELDRVDPAKIDQSVTEI